MGKKVLSKNQEVDIAFISILVCIYKTEINLNPFAAHFSLSLIINEKISERKNVFTDDESWAFEKFDKEYIWKLFFLYWFFYWLEMNFLRTSQESCARQRSTNAWAPPASTGARVKTSWTATNANALRAIQVPSLFTAKYYFHAVLKYVVTCTNYRCVREVYELRTEVHR